MKHLSRDHHIYVLERTGGPAIAIGCDEELMVETWDTFEGVRDPADLEARSLKGPATGPICVDGDEPGDAQGADLVSITQKGGTAPYRHAQPRLPGGRSIPMATRPS